VDLKISHSKFEWLILSSLKVRAELPVFNDLTTKITGGSCGALHPDVGLQGQTWGIPLSCVQGTRHCDIAPHGDVWFQCDSVKGLFHPFAMAKLERPLPWIPWMRRAGFEQKGYIVHNRTQYEFCSRHDSADDG